MYIIKMYIYIYIYMINTTGTYFNHNEYLNTLNKQNIKIKENKPITNKNIAQYNICPSKELDANIYIKNSMNPLFVVSYYK